jgi:hypothetical protein
LINKFIIETNDQLFVCKRRIHDHHITKVEGWEGLLKTLYNVDRIFRKNGLLFLVQDIDEVSEISNIDKVIELPDEDT